MENGDIMRESVTYSNNKTYYTLMLMLIAVMLLGLLVGNPLYGKWSMGYFTHILFVIIVSICVLIYPVYRRRSIRWLIVLTSSIFFYLLFFLYPETGSTVILICFIPAISIMFFDKKLFYFSLILNILLMVGANILIVLSGKQDLYPSIMNDLIGNFSNFLGSQIILLFIFKITSERIKRTELYYEQVKQSVRLKTTGELAAAVAHEIRNPLTVVKGYLQLYEQDKAVDNNMKQSLSLLIGELDSAEQVVTQLLSLSKPSKDIKAEQVEIRNVIYSVTDLLQSYGLLNNNKINVSVEKNCYIAINRMEFNQILVNIIKNAIEASNVGDSITVTARKNKEELVEIKVIDFGGGMSEDEIELLGTPFYSLKNKGTGLGVMICQNIVEKYNGTLTYKSSKGNGTTAIICFPSY